jgi:hypothetical protein
MQAGRPRFIFWRPKTDPAPPAPSSRHRCRAAQPNGCLNAELVTQAAGILHSPGATIATAEDARAMLGLA